MSDQQNLPWWQWLLLGELLLGIITALWTFVPGRTRSDWSFAHLFLSDPTALERFLVNFIVTHVLLGLLIAMAWVLWRYGKHKA